MPIKVLLNLLPASRSAVAISPIYFSSFALLGFHLNTFASTQCFFRNLQIELFTFSLCFWFVCQYTYEHLYICTCMHMYVCMLGMYSHLVWLFWFGKSFGYVCVLCLDSGEWSVCADVCSYVFFVESRFVVCGVFHYIIVPQFSGFYVFCGGDYGNS